MRVFIVHAHPEAQSFNGAMTRAARDALAAAGHDVEVLWDSLDPSWLDRAVAWLTERGLRPYLLFERREEPEFRARFRGHSALGALDWPPRFDLNRQVRIYDPADRARYLAGESYSTDIVGQPRRTQSPRKM